MHDNGGSLDFLPADHPRGRNLEGHGSKDQHGSGAGRLRNAGGHQDPAAGDRTRSAARAKTTIVDGVNGNNGSINGTAGNGSIGAISH